MQEQKKDLPTAYLLKRWQAGDGVCLDALLERHLSWLQRYVRRQMGPLLRARATTIDFVQDAVLELLRYAPRFQVSEQTHFRALMARIVRNTLCDKHDWFTAQRRNIAAEQPLSPDSVLDLDTGCVTTETPSQVVDREQRQAWIRMGVELLDPDDRQVIVLREWEQLAFTAIGARLSISPDAARKRYMRAVPRLAEVVHLLRRGRLPELLEAELNCQKTG